MLRFKEIFEVLLSQDVKREKNIIKTIQVVKSAENLRTQDVMI